jgi:predicted dehydrogenase
MSRKSTRREFVKTSTLAGMAGMGFWVGGCSAPPARRSWSPNEKLNIGSVGCGGKGRSDVANSSSENIVALCDVDEIRAAETFEKFPDATRYHDFRVMFDKEKLDAVTISTPDHMHAPIAYTAMKMGLHVYLQKPMTHTIEEARILRETATEMGVVTQMGNQGTGTDVFREAVEIVQSGVLGAVREVHVWTNRPVWPQGFDLRRPATPSPVPGTLKWDLWLGVAPSRPFAADVYAPFKWRGWVDFGTGALGDMACHTANLPFKALNLGYPTYAAAEHSGFNGETFPTACKIQFKFPKRDKTPAVNFFWYDGGFVPPESATGGREITTTGSLIIGDKATFFSPGDYGGGRKDGPQNQLWPEDDFADYKPPAPTLARVGGSDDLNQHIEWIAACKGNGPTPMSNFDYAGFLTETMLLGNLAVRASHPIEWDGPGMRVKNCNEAQQWVGKEYRKGREWLQEA